MMDGTDSFDPYLYNGSINVDVTYGCIGTVVSLFLFSGINMVTQITGPPRNLKGDIWRWRNTYVSWIHADIIGLGAIYCVFFKPEMFSDLILYCDYEIYLLVSLSMGYFLYDVMDHIMNRRHLSNWEVTLHHVCVLWAFSYDLQYKVNVPYTILALLTEVNSIFLHARKLMQLTQWSFNHWLYRLVLVLNFVTFIVFRLFAVAMVGYGVYSEWYRITIVYRVFIIITMTIMYFINPILLWRLVRNDLLRNLVYIKKKTELNGFKKSKEANEEIKR